MRYTLNHLGQPIGVVVADWIPPSPPSREPLVGTFCRLESLAIDQHASDLYHAHAQDTEGRLWTYLPSGPFTTLDHFSAWMQQACCNPDRLFYAIVDMVTQHAVGIACYLRITPESGSIEVGHITYAPALQRTPTATEAMYLMMQYAFDLGYRRYEWKCDALNAKSCAAAQRLGFSFEGVFRQATVYKGRNRDTAWYATIDHEWPTLQSVFRYWLNPANFDEQGRQRVRLSELTGPLLTRRG